jgi:hypothetical protein
MDYLHNNKSTGTFPDFIFLDLNMPGQNGLDFLELFSAFSTEIKNSATIALLMNVVNEDDPETRKATTHPLATQPENTSAPRCVRNGLCKSSVSSMPMRRSSRRKPASGPSIFQAQAWQMPREGFLTSD